MFLWNRSNYRVIRTSLREFWPLRYSSRDGQVEGEHTNRGRDTPSFSPTLQVLDMSTLGEVADANSVITFLPHMLHVCGWNLITGFTSAASLRVDLSSNCKLRQKFGVPLPLLTCSPSTWSCRLLYRRGRKSRSDLWITLYLTLRRSSPSHHSGRTIQSKIFPWELRSSRILRRE